MLSGQLFHLLGDFIILRLLLEALLRRWGGVDGARLADPVVVVTEDQPNVLIRADVHTWRTTPKFKGRLKKKKKKKKKFKTKKESQNMIQNITKP